MRHQPDISVIRALIFDVKVIFTSAKCNFTTNEIALRFLNKLNLFVSRYALQK